MAQPFRFLAHNGEINTVQGNRHWMEARAPQLAFPDGVALRRAAAGRQPGRAATRSASTTSLELLYHGGRSLPHALMMLVPEPWEQLPEMDPARRAFYDFHAGLIEQWDGPAALAFTDGVLAGATLDRNGLRPLRYAITADGLFIAGSEAGTVAVDQATVVEKGRLGPGQMIVVDTRRGIVLRNDEIKREVVGAAAVRGVARAGRVALDVSEADRRAIPTAASNGTPVRPDRPGDRRRPARLRLLRPRTLRLIVHPMAGGQGTDLVDGRRRAAGGPLRAAAPALTPTSGSASPRSPTRRSTRCASGR